MADNLAETGLQSWSIYTAADEADKGVERLRAPPKGLYKTSSTFPRLRELKTHSPLADYGNPPHSKAIYRQSTGPNHLRPVEVCDEGSMDVEPSQVHTLPVDEVLEDQPLVPDIQDSSNQKCAHQG